MVKLLLILCIIIILTVAWIIGLKIYKTQKFIQKRRKSQAPDQGASIRDSSYIKNDEIVVVHVDAYEQQLFDDIADLFMEQEQLYAIDHAEKVEDAGFRKMPVCSKTQIRKLDLEEWSIYWTFYDQSLEYYVGKYGVFYAHVDRFGAEHKHEIRRQGTFS